MRALRAFQAPDRLGFKTRPVSPDTGDVKEKWNAWDVPFFVTPGSKPVTQPGPEPLPEPAPEATPAPERARPFAVGALPLAGEGALRSERIMAVLMGVAAIAAGFLTYGVLLVLSFFLSFGATPESMTAPVLLGVAVALIGLTLAVLTYRAASRPAEIVVGADSFALSFPTFRDPLIVRREMVRVVSIDDKPMRRFQNNKRFEIAGSLPGHVFADQLDNKGRPPWEDFDPERHRANRTVPGIWGALGRAGAAAPGPGGRAPAEAAVPRPDGYSHDDPDRDGWASGGGAPATLPPAEGAHLWSAHGSSLPFVALAPGEVPNLAILFQESQRTSKPPWWYDFSPICSHSLRFRGGRSVRGILLKVRNPLAANEAFDRWGVVRQITADDVLEEGLIVAKPLRGMRAVAYTAILLGSFVIEFVLRRLN